MFDPQKPPLDELAHYGVKGMKWGIRKERAQDVLTDAERSASKAHMKQQRKVLIDRVIEKRYRNKGTIAEKSPEQLSTERFVLKKGSEVYRVTTRKNEQLRDLTYVSTNEMDRKIYQAIIPSLGGRGGKKKYIQTYEHTFKLTKKLTLPSEKDRMDAFNEILESRSIKAYPRDITGKQYLKKMGYGRDVRRLETAQLGQKHFNDMMETSHANTPLASAYFKNLSSKGFQALQDDNDKGILSRDPIILLNPNGSLKQMSVRPLTNKDVNNALTNFNSDLTSRKAA